MSAAPATFVIGSHTRIELPRQLLRLGQLEKKRRRSSMIEEPIVDVEALLTPIVIRDAST